MGQQGIVDFFGASQVELQDILPLIFSCEGQAQAMGRYTEDEFVRAMTCLGISSETEFASKRDTIKNRFLNDKALFNKLWKYSFGYMAMGQKYVKKQICSMMLPVLCKGKYSLGQKVVGFLSSDAVSFNF